MRQLTRPKPNAFVTGLVVGLAIAAWVVLLLIAITFFMPLRAHAGEPSGWGGYPPEIHAWFPTVMQPGKEALTATQYSCCGEADAFEADQVAGEDARGNIQAVITNGKGIVPDGTVISVPRDKIQIKYGNPVDHIIVFISVSDHKTVYCYVPKFGV